MYQGRNLRFTVLIGVAFLLLIAALRHAQGVAPAGVLPMGPDTGVVAFITGLLGLASSSGHPRI